MSLVLIRSLGNVLMLSEGRVGIDNVYLLKEGEASGSSTLQMELLISYRSPNITLG